MNLQPLLPSIASTVAYRSRLSALALACGALALCSTAQSQTAPPASRPVAAASKSAVAVATTPSRMDADLFYQLLLGELKATGGEPDTGFALLLDAARKTGDAKLYERAVDIAIQSRSGDAALQAARAWTQAQPKSPQANERHFQVLVALNRLPESVEPLRALLSNSPSAQRGALITRSLGAYSRVSDKKLAVTTAEQALADYLNANGTAAPAWTAVGRLRLAATDTAGALDAARKAQAANPNDESAAVLALEIMEPKQPQAEAIVKRYLEVGQPRPEIRMGYVRALIDAQRYVDAGAQIQAVNRDKPDYAEAWLVQGSLQLQDNQLPAADTSLKRYVQLAQEQSAGEDRQRGLTQAYLLLAQIAEKRKDFPLAESWIAKIDSSAALVSTQSRRASILAKQGKMDEARKLIRALPDRSEADQRMKMMAEVQLLRDNQLHQAAYDLLADGLARNPKDHELLYDQAMMAEKLDRFAEMEKLLRQLIAAKPDHAQAYNALGYSMAERNVRLVEAKALIQKALEYAVGDPFITDSLGWVEFRLGNQAEAIKLLEGAYKSKPDPEIAAHLGEVYWVNGQRDKAVAVWKEGMLLNSENETLLETLKRLRVKL